MNNLKNKLKKQGGFTLVEMLIVVAIIAILIMVSIPTVSAALERAKVATDEANQRSAMGAAEIRYLSSLGTNSSDPDHIDFGTGKSATFYYHINGGQGEVKLSTEGTPKGYGQCDKHSGGYIQIVMTDKGNITMTWANATSTELDGSGAVEGGGAG